MNKSYVWIIGGGLMQLPIIDAAHARGYQVLVTDRNAACPAAKQVAMFRQLDVYDIASHLDLAKWTIKHKFNVVGVVADAIDVGQTAAAVADYLGLPSVGFQAAKLLGNKADFRTVVTPHKRPYFTIGMPDEHITEIYIKWLKVMRADDRHVLPCVIKPSDNCASRGVSLVKGLEEFGPAIEKARKSNHNDKRVVVEQYCPGIEYSTDWWVFPDGRAVQVNGSKRTFDSAIFGLERIYTNPHGLPTELTARVELAVKAVGHQGGPLKLDWTYSTDYGWLLMEGAARWSGGMDHTHAKRLSCGDSLVNELLSWATGEAFDVSKMCIPAEHRWACAFAPLYAPGKVREWQIPTDITDGYIINRELTIISEPTDCSTRPIFVIAGGDTEIAASEHAQLLAKQVLPIYA
jgi:biotin carboxylase